MTDQLADAPVDIQYHAMIARFHADFAWRNAKTLPEQHYLSSAIEYLDKVEDLYRSSDPPPKAA